MRLRRVRDDSIAGAAKDSGVAHATRVSRGPVFPALKRWAEFNSRYAAGLMHMLRLMLTGTPPVTSYQVPAFDLESWGIISNSLKRGM